MLLLRLPRSLVLLRLCQVSPPPLPLFRPNLLPYLLPYLLPRPQLNQHLRRLLNLGRTARNRGNSHKQPNRLLLPRPQHRNLLRHLLSQ